MGYGEWLSLAIHDFFGSGYDGQTGRLIGTTGFWQVAQGRSGLQGGTVHPHEAGGFVVGLRGNPTEPRIAQQAQPDHKGHQSRAG